LLRYVDCLFAVFRLDACLKTIGQKAVASIFLIAALSSTQNGLANSWLSRVRLALHRPPIFSGVEGSAL
jgi:hypothetical protein